MENIRWSSSVGAEIEPGRYNAMILQIYTGKLELK
jgi:hypothetical protein